MQHKKDENVLFNVMSRSPNGDMTVFSASDKTLKNIIFTDDLNINALDN